MPKKSLKITPSKMREKAVVEEEKPSSVQKTTGSEIDEIFSGKKRKKSELPKIEKPNEDEVTRPKKLKKKKSKESREAEFVDPPSRSRKRTNDGLTIYTEEELQINNAEAGSTPLCPFDCSCCF